jgi:hypothetical protein
MRLLRTKSEPERIRDTLSDSIAERVDTHRGTLLKAAVIAGCAAALTAGSAAISSLRRQTGANS